MIKIDKDVPLPTRAKKARTEKYAVLRQLEVGDSFAVPIGRAALAAHARRVAKETGRKFIVRDEEGNSRVWRKA
jgi:hypothetical protein